jgi:hypothetical protein
VRSTVAPQALAIMNSPWVESRAKAAAMQIEYECRSENPDNTHPNSEAFRIERSFHLAFGRSPDEKERKWATRILEAKGLEELAHQLMASIEFRFIE